MSICIQGFRMGGEGVKAWHLCQSHAGHSPVICRSHSSHMPNIPRWIVKLSSSGGGVVSAENSSGG